MANLDKKYIVIKGATKEGDKFRPSDWAERISSSFATYGKNKRMSYSNFLYPDKREGISCLVIDSEMEIKESMVFNYLMRFAASNNLQIIE